jgi:hypothetical protein
MPKHNQMMVCGMDGHFTKNALHLAAWKGDIESIMLLIEAGKKFNLDLVNVISTGIGNYGKSPIFYAITQDRDDVVRLLIDSGSNLLIVNNKGQTPSSLSIAHLTAETQQILFEEERRQLACGGNFTNYRLSNSDNRQYGDLDPRFPIDQVNWGEDIDEEFQRFGILDQISFINGSITSNSVVPKCVRQTTAQTRLIKAVENKLKIPIHTPSVIDSSCTSTEPLESNRQKYSQRQTLVICEPPITLKDVSHLNSEANINVVIVQSYDQLILFETEVQNFVDKINESLELEPFQTSWALDCEWKPTKKATDHPVSVLQLSTISVCYIIDLQSLCQTSLPPSNIGSKMTETELVLSSSLSKLFSDRKIYIVGFDIMNDLERLFASFPYIPCFTHYESVIDLRNIISKSIPSFSCGTITLSLKNVVQELLHKNLDKMLQCSDWSEVRFSLISYKFSHETFLMISMKKRPLSEGQIEYAALDAIVLLLLLEWIVKQPLESRLRWMSHQASVHFDIDQRAESNTHQKQMYGKKGRAMKILGHSVIRYIWFSHENLERHSHNTGHQDISTDLYSSSKRRPYRSMKCNDEMISSAILACNFKTLPAIGENVGFTKDDCIKRYLSESMHDHRYSISFNRRSDIIQLANAWALFVTYRLDSTRNQSTPNNLSHGEHHVHLFVDLKNSEQCRILRDINDESENSKILLLSARFMKGGYFYCGQCKCVSRTIIDHQMKLTLELETREQNGFEAMLLK